ncbi:unnamed protein product [Porites evermanni]|uniref:Uncharacterized protein n=1 Tax=Porites evermanni TaxID=104178 RepID=A0ABN8LK26_9CNID|nr:unnamed protein product [Porites evermanni]
MGYFNKLNTGYYRSEEMPIKQRQCVTSLHPNECILSIDDWACASCKALQPAPNIYLNRYNWDTPETMHVIENGVPELETLNHLVHLQVNAEKILLLLYVVFCLQYHNTFLLTKKKMTRRTTIETWRKKLRENKKYACVILLILAQKCTESCLTWKMISEPFDPVSTI